MGFLVLLYFLLIFGIGVEIFFSFRFLLMFGEFYFWILMLGKLVSFVIILVIIRNSKSLNKDILWIVMIMLFPFIGGLIYFILGSDIIKSSLLKDISSSFKECKKYFVCDKKLEDEVLSNQDSTLKYLVEYCGYPVTRNNKVKYYSTGDVFFQEVKKEMKRAKKFIFVEFFTIAMGELWDEVLDILVEKVNEGVEVRIIYDNTVCMKKIPAKYYKKLMDMGIKCEPYFKKNYLFGIIKNHHEHRKCVIIDGKIAFTGGMNIEDRYVNLEKPYGYWKDVGVSISGDGVWNFTVMFLSMWRVLSKCEEDFFEYKCSLINRKNEFGYVVSFGDNPLDCENVGNNTYINMIYQARESLTIFTPYLILDMDLYQAIALAAKRGVDVKIVIPGIPDKNSVYQVSLINARKLVKEGVKVYTYTPGFIHGKVFLVDDRKAIVGTINTDYRSFYFDFEYGILIADCLAIKEIKRDVEEVLEQSKQVVLKKANCFRVLKEAFLQLFSSLM